MPAFRPNKKAFLGEERILRDRFYRDERPALIDLLKRLRAAQSPGDYFFLQLDLFQRVKGRQDQIDRMRGVLAEQQDRLKALARAEVRDTAALSDAQSAVRNVEFSIEVERALNSVLSCVADGLVWRALNYNRAAIAVLGTGARVNRLSAEEGLLPELHEIEAYWERGIFAIHNDLTTCLRHGDVTAITSRGNEIVEVKASSSGDARRQMVRLREAADLINLGRRTDSAGVTAHIVRVERPYRSRLRHVAGLLREVREHGYAAKRVSSCQLVTATHVGALQDALERRACDRAELGWYDVPEATVVNFTTFVRRMRDRRYSAAVLAPLSIYPVDVEDLADLMLGYLEFTTDLNVAVIRDRLVAVGVSVELASGRGADSQFFIARHIVGDRELGVHVDPTLREQLLLELMYPEDAVASVRAVLAAAEGETGPQRVDRILAMTSEARVWEAWPR